MSKRKRRLTPAEKAHKKLMREKYEWVFLNGKQKRIRRAPTIEGMPADEFIRRNADPIWLVQNDMYEELHEWQKREEGLEEGLEAGLGQGQGPSGTQPAAREAVHDNLPF